MPDSLYRQWMEPRGNISCVAEVLEEQVRRTPARNVIVFLDNHLSISRIYNMPQRTFALHTTDKMNPLDSCCVHAVKTLLNKQLSFPNKIMLVEKWLTVMFLNCLRLHIS
jgi:hypothetical protein